jgi:hypothetical protein
LKTFIHLTFFSIVVLKFFHKICFLFDFSFFLKNTLPFFSTLFQTNYTAISVSCLIRWSSHCNLFMLSNSRCNVTLFVCKSCLKYFIIITWKIKTDLSPCQILFLIQSFYLSILLDFPRDFCFQFDSLISAITHFLISIGKLFNNLFPITIIFLCADHQDFILLFCPLFFFNPTSKIL